MMLTVKLLINGYTFYLSGYGKNTKRISPGYGGAKNYINRYTVLIDTTAINRRKEMLDWLDNNIEGYYAFLVNNEICFIEKTDAMAFKLRWI